MENPRYRAVTRANVGRLPFWDRLESDLREAIEIVSLVLPFRINEYVCSSLIDWDNVPDDPIFQLTFPQRGMLADDHYEELRSMREHGSKDHIARTVERIRFALNPHPAGQMTHNRAVLDGKVLDGIQHKYRETVLFFPAHGQTCHAYCTFCFRWAQFIGLENLKFSSKEVEGLCAYLRRHPEISDVLITGGDPMVMKDSLLEKYLEPLLEIESVRSIRIGTKSVAYWPQRYVSDADADGVLRTFERVVDSGRQLAIMGHYSHPVELSTRVAQQAVQRIRATGANIRMQSPVLRHINDDVSAWVDLWTKGVQLGCIPYYMFVERDTGARRYFEMPIVRCWNIYRNAYQRVSGLARTVRGPSMSCFPGKCHVIGVTENNGEQAFCLQYLQAREPDLVRRPFFAKYSPEASWFDQLEPLGESDKPFFPETESTPAFTPLHVRSN